MLKILIFIAAVLADRISKICAMRYLMPVGTYPLIPKVLHLTYAENTGAAFSMLAGKTVFLTVFTVIVCVALAYVLFSGKIKSKTGNWSLVLILSGAVGNAIDRIIRGAVVDFFEIKLFDFAIFNVADVYISVGAVLLCVYILFFSEDKEDKKK